MEAIRVLIVDDHAVVRDGLSTMLGREKDFVVVGQGLNGRDAIEKAAECLPDVILMDLRMPEMDGVEAMRRIRADDPDARLLVLTTFDSDEYIFDAIEAGARGYLLKDVSRQELFEAVRAAHRGESLIEPAVAAKVLERLVRLSNQSSKTATLAERRVELAEPEVGAPEGTVTILFTDIVGSTSMTERLGDSRAQQVLQDHNAIVRGQVAEHGGFEVKSQGDGFMVAFSSARRAIECAVAVQRGLAAYNRRHIDEPISVRIGLHTGETIRAGSDFFGKTVIVASRITEQAGGSQILVSSLLRELTESSGAFEFREWQETELKGLSRKYWLHEVRWQ